MDAYKLGKALDQWRGVDLDGTLAKYDGWKGPTEIGDPVPKMVQRIKRWLRNGENVKILTARVSGADAGAARKAIQRWAEEHIGQILPVTCKKDHGMKELWDDRVIQVEPNTGEKVAIGCYSLGEKSAGIGGSLGRAALRGVKQIPWSSFGKTVKSWLPGQAGNAAETGARYMGLTGRQAANARYFANARRTYGMVHPPAGPFTKWNPWQGAVDAGTKMTGGLGNRLGQGAKATRQQFMGMLGPVEAPVRGYYSGGLGMRLQTPSYPLRRHEVTHAAIDAMRRTPNPAASLPMQWLAKLPKGSPYRQFGEELFADVTANQGAGGFLRRGEFPRVLEWLNPAKTLQYAKLNSWTPAGVLRDTGRAAAGAMRGFGNMLGMKSGAYDCGIVLKRLSKAKAAAYAGAPMSPKTKPRGSMPAPMAPKTTPSPVVPPPKPPVPMAPPPRPSTTVNPFDYDPNFDIAKGSGPNGLNVQGLGDAMRRMFGGEMQIGPKPPPLPDDRPGAAGLAARRQAFGPNYTPPVLPGPPKPPLPDDRPGAASLRARQKAFGFDYDPVAAKLESDQYNREQAAASGPGFGEEMGQVGKDLGTTAAIRAGLSFIPGWNQAMVPASQAASQLPRAARILNYIMPEATSTWSLLPGAARTTLRSAAMPIQGAMTTVAAGKDLLDLAGLLPGDEVGWDMDAFRRKTTPDFSGGAGWGALDYLGSIPAGFDSPLKGLWAMSIPQAGPDYYGGVKAWANSGGIDEANQMRQQAQQQATPFTQDRLELMGRDSAGWYFDPNLGQYMPTRQTLDATGQHELDQIWRQRVLGAAPAGWQPAQ